MLLGVLLHAIIAYKVYPNPSWPSDNKMHSYFFDGLYFFIHSFRMQLFFVVAGFFARMLYLRIGERSFIQHRIRRIIIPFAASLIFILPFTIAPFLYYKYFIADALPRPEAWAAFRSQFFRWNGMAHLWFLYYLVFFYIAMLVLQRPVFRNLVPAFLRKRKINMSSVPQPLVAGIMLALVQIIFSRELVIEVSTGIVPRLPNLLYYGFFFAAGYLMHKNAARLGDLRQRAWTYISFGALLAVAAFYMVVLRGEHATPFVWAIKLVLAMQTVFLTFGMIGLFLKYLNRESAAFRYMSDASYWIYIVHLMMVAGLQIAFLFTDIPGGLRFILILAVTSAVSLATYQWFVRYTFIGTALHGPRKRPARQHMVNLNA